jgi:hypothetical protein
MANGIIKDGLEICGARIRPEKLKQEPLQCLRCRHWGHFAANCTEPTDICGTCGENHRTTQCKETEKKHCISCSTDTHVSWDRNCPEFVRRSRIYDENHLENNMVYFSTDKNWTLTTCLDRIPLEERFPPWFTVNSIQPNHKKPHAKIKKTNPFRQIPPKNTQGKEQSTINKYFSCTQSKGKERETASEKDDPQTADQYEECFDNLENNDIECLLGSPFH